MSRTHLCSRKRFTVEYVIWIILFCFLSATIVFWFSSRHVKATWTNVPPAPSVLTASGVGLGDGAFSYRSYGIALQNMGDTGGRTTSLNDYNYERLSDWFEVLHVLDPRSNFVPYIASYYFGGLELETHRLRPLVMYLARAGNTHQGEKWRWLAQAAYLARFKMKDLDLALNLAKQLRDINSSNMPLWARNMEANVLNARGEKEAALGMLLGILESEAETMHPNERNATIAYVCEQILTQSEWSNYPLCFGNY